MHEVFRSYNKKLEDAFKKVDLFSSAGKNRLLSDVHYLVENLSALDGVDGPGSQLEVCVNNIKIKDKRTYQAQKPAPIPEKRGSNPAVQPAPPRNAFAYSFGKMLRNQNEGQ